MDIEKEELCIPMTLMKEHVDRLLATPDKLKYLLEKRKITTDIITKYMIGLDQYGRFIFPNIDSDSRVINMKAYNPLVTDRSKKWVWSDVEFYFPDNNNF